MEPQNFDFGFAINILKSGGRVQRQGWNGKGMWLALTPGSQIAHADARSVATRSIAAEQSNATPDGYPVPSIAVGGHIDMRAADGSLVVGWLASQTDMLAEDWQRAP